MVVCVRTVWTGVDYISGSPHLTFWHSLACVSCGNTMKWEKQLHRVQKTHWQGGAYLAYRSQVCVWQLGEEQELFSPHDSIHVSECFERSWLRVRSPNSTGSWPSGTANAPNSPTWWKTPWAQLSAPLPITHSWANGTDWTVCIGDLPVAHVLTFGTHAACLSFSS